MRGTSAPRRVLRAAIPPVVAVLVVAVPFPATAREQRFTDAIGGAVASSSSPAAVWFHPASGSAGVCSATGGPGVSRRYDWLLIQTGRLLAEDRLLEARAAQRDAGRTLEGFARRAVMENLADTLVGGPGYGGAGGQGVQVLDNLRSRAAASRPIDEVVGDYVRLTSITDASEGALRRGLRATLRRLERLARSGRISDGDAAAVERAASTLAATLDAQSEIQRLMDALDDPCVAGSVRRRSLPAVESEVSGWMAAPL